MEDFITFVERGLERYPSFPFWRVSSKVSEPLLYKIGNTHYQTTIAGTFGHLLSHRLYILIHKTLLEFFQSHGPLLHSASPVSIYNKPTNSYIPDYFCIEADHISADYSHLIPAAPKTIYGLILKLVRCLFHVS